MSYFAIVGLREAHLGIFVQRVFRAILALLFIKVGRQQYERLISFLELLGHLISDAAAGGCNSEAGVEVARMVVGMSIGGFTMIRDPEHRHPKRRLP